jgi:hypothetical protein
VDLIHLLQLCRGMSAAVVAVLNTIKWSPRLPKPADAFLERYLSYSKAQQQFLCRLIRRIAGRNDVLIMLMETATTRDYQKDVAFFAINNHIISLLDIESQIVD